MRLPGLALVLLLLAAPAAAGELMVYRCTDGDGLVALRDTPCPAGLREQTIEMQRPVAPPPVPRLISTEPAPAPPTPAPLTRVVYVEAPRPIYQCTTPDGDTYTADNADGNPRWVPMWTLGYPVVLPRNPLGDRVGAPPPEPPGDGPGLRDRRSTVGLPYAPGTWIRDQCVRLPRAQACALLREQKRELRDEWFDAMPTRRAEVAEEEQVLVARLAATCAG